MNNSLVGKDILSADQFDPETLEFILRWTEMMKEIEQSGKPCNLLKGKILTNLFYQQSSRTFGSFLGAMQRLEGGIIPIHGAAEYSSVAKGEDLYDTVATFSNYCDAIALRHPDDNSSEIAARASRKPIINAGSGRAEHPTQAVLDIATIQDYVRESGRKRGDLVLTMVGDLGNGRTVHSLLNLWPAYTRNSNRVFCVAPERMRMPIEFLRKAKQAGLDVEETTDLSKVLPETDILYMTRVQKEWFKDPEEYERVRLAYVLTPELMERAKPQGQMIIMHPLPRAGEIPHSIDTDPRAYYLRKQEPYGLWSRMAILGAVLGLEENQILEYTNSMR